MKHLDKALAFVLGSVVTIAVVAMIGTGFATLREAEGLRIRIATLERVLRESEAKVRAGQQLSKAREDEDRAMKMGDAATLRAAQDVVRKAEAEAASATTGEAQVQVASGGWHPLHVFGLAPSREIEESKIKVAALEQALRDSASRSEAESIRQKMAEHARAAEIAALKAGDQAKLKEAQEAAKRAEEEAARKALSAAGKSQSPAAAPPPVRTVSAAEAETLYQQALAMESGNAKDAIRIYRRAARAGSGKAAKRLGEIYDRGAPGIARDYAESLQWYETARQLGEKIDTSGPSPRPITRSEREQRADAEASQQALNKALEEHAQAQEIEALYQQGLAMESSGKAADAIRLYRRAARANNGKAAKRLGDIYACGVPGVSRDYAESLQWYETARRLGENVPTAGNRSGNC